MVAPARAAITVGPYVQDVRPDGFTIAFETDAPVAATVSLPGHDAVTAPGTRHEARVEHLAPSTRYHYRVRAGDAELDGGDVITAPEGPHPFTFVVLGDTRDGPETEQAVIKAALAESPELALHAGDFVPIGGDAAAWPAFFNAERTLLAGVPLYPAAGNHELYQDAEGANFRRWFVLPEGGRDARHYSFRWGAARFVVLDANATGAAHADETRWLERTLAEKNPGPTFVLMHQPALSMGGHCGAGSDDADWVALFERFRVRAVFAGHDHAYQRLERNGVRYFVSGGGGARLYDQRDSCPAYDHAAHRVYAAEHHYLRVRVSGDRVELAALRPSGSAIETVLLDDLPLVAGAAPPLDVAGSPLPRRWPLAAFTILIVAVLGGILRRRWSR
ncbi:MAG TPA: metallophosphoesterase family protein [Polyangia bacterium]|nr:metallophosphoesterase family protein [Polyangia bacterium]